MQTPALRNKIHSVAPTSVRATVACGEADGTQEETSKQGDSGGGMEV